MANSVLIDTDVMIDFLRGYPKAVALIQSHTDSIIISTIVVAELYAGVKGEEELSKLNKLISLFNIIPVSIELARTAGLYKNRYAKSHGIGLADAIIAATAESENANLKTLNIKHFPMINGLKPAYQKM